MYEIIASGFWTIPTFMMATMIGFGVYDLIKMVLKNKEET